MDAEFDLRLVEEGLVATRFEGHVMHLSSVGSTNQVALEAAQSGAREGVWVADEQTSGRGRGGHTWHSAAGEGLYVSVLVRPAIPVSEAAKLSLATGLAVRAAVLETTGLSADIRWPNDLMFGELKFGGILVESASDGARAGGGGAAALRFAVIGIGINVNHAEFPAELGGVASSLRIAGGREFPREPLLAALLRHLDGELHRLDAEDRGAEGEQALGSRFARASTWAEGRRVTVEEAGGYRGITRGLDPHGFLLVEDDAGVLRRVLSGGVRSA